MSIMHSEHEALLVARRLEFHEPNGQSEQLATDGAPTSGPKVPKGQAVQLAVPVVEFAGPSVYDPAAQTLHELEPTPAVVVPTGQEEQELEALTAYVPTRQGKQFVDELAPEMSDTPGKVHALPGANETHVTLLVALMVELYLPIRHGMHRLGA